MGDKKSLTSSVEIISSVKQIHPSTLEHGTTGCFICKPMEQTNSSTRKGELSSDRISSSFWLSESLCTVPWWFFCFLVCPQNGNCHKSWLELASVHWERAENKRLWNIDRYNKSNPKVFLWFVLELIQISNQICQKLQHFNALLGPFNI